MVDIIIRKLDESSLHIDADSDILRELKEKFTFDVPGAKYTPKFRAKMWDGKISLLDLRKNTLPTGLYSELVAYAKHLGYSVQTNDSNYGNPSDKDSATYEDVEKFMLYLNLHSKNNKIEPRTFQIQAVFNCIKNQKQISVTPTGGGKSLILYCLYRWYEAKGKSFMLVVPNLSLIRQMQSDFEDYSSHNEFDVLSNLYVISEGAPKTLKTSLTLSTWQSIYKQPSSWFNSLDVIAGDEIHGFKADAVKGIFEKATEVKYRFGVTGSLDKTVVNEMVLRGLIGEISQVKSTRDLIEDGHLSDVKIHCIILKYNDVSKKLIRAADYQTEVDFICDHERRNKFICKLALSLTGNTLVLFTRVEQHGEPLYEEIKKAATKQKVFMVSGKVDADDRENIRKAIQASVGDTITVASVGTMSTGVNIPRLHNIIFASPTKSVIRVMQSIGRGLRLSEGKSELKLFDICDSIVPSKTKPNHTLKHFTERLRIYTAEKHSYKITEVSIE